MQHSEPSESLTSGRISLYAAGFGAASVGVVVMGRAVSDPSFVMFAMAFLAVGFAISAAVRLGRIHRSMAECALLAALMVCTLLIFINPAFRYLVLPIRSLTSPDLVLSTILVWLMVVYSFNLRTDRSVLFMCVPSLSLIGLMSTFDPTGQSLVSFIMYLCFACFALIQQNALSHAAPEEHRAVRGNLKLAVVIAVQAILVGSVMGWAMRTVLTRATGPSLLARNGQSSSETFLESDFMQVAAGPTVLGEREVMTVRCSEPLLWRSQVYDRYTGRGWTSTESVGDQPVLVSSPGHFSQGNEGSRFPTFPSSFRLPIDPESRHRLSVKQVDQIFHLIGGRTTSLYSAAEPIIAAFRGPQMLESSNGRTNFRLPYGTGKSYAVSSVVSTATPQMLRRASTVYSRDMEDRYVEQVPDSCLQFAASVEQLVGPMPTNYDKVVAIQNYLEKNYSYDLSAPAAPIDEDAVAHFLLRSRRGYCDIFASSMAIMCRLAKIPCRVAVGYATGKRDPGGGVFHVRQKDRHAWVEVYFPDYGWIAFDPAPQEAGASLSDRLSATWRSMVKKVTSQGSSFWMFGVLFLLVGYLFKVEVIDRLRVRQRVRRSSASMGRAAENYRRMCDAFARLGYPRSAAMTPTEYCRGLERLLRPNCESLVAAVYAVTEDFIAARYAGRQLPRERTASTASMLADLIREAKQAARQRVLSRIGDQSGR